MKYSIRGVCLNEAGADPSILGVSVIAVCPTCATPWLRLEVSGHDWRGFTVACADCPPWPFEDSVPGSTLSVVGTDMLTRLPAAVLRHELDVHLKYFEKRS